MPAMCWLIWQQLVIEKKECKETTMIVKKVEPRRDLLPPPAAMWAALIVGALYSMDQFEYKSGSKLAIRDYWRWCRGAQHLTIPNCDIQQASRMWRMGNYDIPLVFTSALRNERRPLSDALYLLMLINQMIQLKYKYNQEHTSAKVKFLLQHIYDDEEVLLALVEVCSTDVIDGVPWPYGTNKRKALKAAYHCLVLFQTWGYRGQAVADIFLLVKQQ
ncbi:hypothetical protein O0I10_000957 [Lichtheimia ornata]|uniref:Uncharacterized protein n=1 Tax=Lichtheimia ornata TaxID=688661 RepID=A0AAD8DJE6_9FUNG|nr:uncharacterized protein O0I10_000957 [Lichtheimia ornata]KAJ8663708.1 hypothetical protein O0I10_000957 [Lichtheimia ornata]